MPKKTKTRRPRRSTKSAVPEAATPAAPTAPAPSSPAKPVPCKRCGDEPISPEYTLCRTCRGEVLDLLDGLSGFTLLTSPGATPKEVQVLARKRTEVLRICDDSTVLMAALNKLVQDSDRIATDRKLFQAMSQADLQLAVNEALLRALSAETERDKLRADLVAMTQERDRWYRNAVASEMGRNSDREMHEALTKTLQAAVERSTGYLAAERLLRFPTPESMPVAPAPLGGGAGG